jgi:hypothetical protein
VEELLAGPLPLSEELGTAGGALGATSAGWGPPTGAPGMWILGGGPGRRSDGPPHHSHQGSVVGPAPLTATLNYRRAAKCPGEVSKIQG